MRFCIITVYNSHNFGSYLQALKLGQVLEKYGEVHYLDSKSRKMMPSFIRKIKKIIINSFKMRQPLVSINGIIFEIIELMNLKHCWKNLNTISSFEKTDIVVLGSDEIWNISRKACRYPIYWGANIKKYKVAYAPSINQSKVEDFFKNPEYFDYLKDIDNISVRDEYSKRVIGQFINKPINLVLDPTLLFNPEQHTYKISQPYIAVYLFYGSLKEEEIKEILSFAKSNNLLLVSAGQYIPWCNQFSHSIKGNPFYIFNDAEFVITNTFHGTAYAINSNTKFASFSKGKPKIEAMLNQLGFSDRIVNAPTELKSILEKPIDYKQKNAILAKFRDESFDYIQNAILNHEDYLSTRRFRS